MALLRHFGQRYARSLLWEVSRYAPILQTRGVKLDTGIVGLKVVPNAREVLKDRLNDVLDAVAEQIPAEAEYRKAVEATVKHRCGAAPPLKSICLQALLTRLAPGLCMLAVCLQRLHPRNSTGLQPCLKYDAELTTYEECSMHACQSARPELSRLHIRMGGQQNIAVACQSG